MTRKTITIPCDLLSKMGRKPEEGVPFGALNAWVADLKRQIPDDEEPSCNVLGTQGLVAQYQHVLTPAEIQAEKLEALEAARREVAGILGKEGTPTAAELARVRAILAGA